MKKVSNGLKATRPVHLLDKPLKANFRDLFRSLTKAAASGAILNWSDAAKNAIDAIGAVGFQQDPGETAWLLIHRSIVSAVYKIVEEHADLIRSSPTAYWQLYEQLELPTLAREAIIDELDLSLEHSDFFVDDNFFAKPGELPLLQEIKKLLVRWLSGIGLTDAQAETVGNKLPRYFVEALNNEWYERHDKYEVLKLALDTPFTKANEREREWMRYASGLLKQIEEPMFYEAFSLRQVFVPLRAFGTLKPSSSTYINKIIPTEHGDREEDDIGREQDSVKRELIHDRIVVDLETELIEWLESANPHDAIRIISGGPGSGKSSFAKMFAARQSTNSERRVLFIPLHRFEPSDDLVTAVGEYVKYEQILSFNPLDPQSGESRLLIIFDGLDELSMQGRAAADVAQGFIHEVQRKIDRFNHREARLLVLVSGRELAVQAHAGDFRKEKQILHLLPYYLPGNDIGRYYDPGELLRTDQRQQWWALYGNASGRGYEAMPLQIDQDALVDITSQPLLNYLVALSFTRGKLNLEDGSNLNVIYADLLDAVYQRVWGENDHPALSGVSEDLFFRILEEIAVAAWHGESRTTTIREIEIRCSESGLGSLLNKFREGAKESVARLLLAFYFRKYGNRQTGEESFEFTHKSFSEYLTARRIVRSIRRIQDEIAHRTASYDGGWSESEALVHWVRLCGPVPIDQYVFKFVMGELLIWAADAKAPGLVDVQSNLCHLFEAMLSRGMPMEGLQPRPSFKEETRQARNAGISLLIAINACARVTRERSKIEYPSRNALGDWLVGMQSQGSDSEHGFTLECLSYLEARNCTLSWAQLPGANLEESDLLQSDLHGMNLEEANCRSANLQEANLRYTNLQAAILEKANLKGADLSGADLREVNLREANLAGANLAEANLRNADLLGANIEGTEFVGARLIGVRWVDGRKVIDGMIGRMVFENDLYDDDLLELRED